MIYWCRNTSTVLHVRWCQTHREQWVNTINYTVVRQKYPQRVKVGGDGIRFAAHLPHWRCHPDPGSQAKFHIWMLAQKSKSTNAVLPHFNPSVAPFSIKIPDH